MSDGDELTPLEAHNSMLYPKDMKMAEKEEPRFDIVELHMRGRTHLTPPRQVLQRTESRERLVRSPSREVVRHGPVEMYSQESLGGGYRQPQVFESGYRGGMI